MIGVFAAIGACVALSRRRRRRRQREDRVDPFAVADVDSSPDGWRVHSLIDRTALADARLRP